MVRRNFVALVVVALMVSFCGTPPEAGDLQTVTGEQVESQKDGISDKAVITAVVIGTGVVVCYLAPGVKTKCPAGIKRAWGWSRTQVSAVGKRIGDGSKKVWNGIKKPFTSKSGGDNVAGEASETVGRNAGETTDAASKKASGTGDAGSKD